MPAALRRLPTLTDAELQYCNAYEFMNPAKYNGLGRGLIPLSEYAAYQQLFELPEHVEVWAQVVRAIDVELTHRDNENPQS